MNTVLTESGHCVCRKATSDKELLACYVRRTTTSDEELLACYIHLAATSDEELLAFYVRRTALKVCEGQVKVKLSLCLTH
jgi:hypothetical protein